MSSVSLLRRKRMAAAAALACAAILSVTACSNSVQQQQAAQASQAAAANSAAAGKPVNKCGLGNGQKATGDPVKIGAIVTKQAGVDFTQITDAAQAYFTCVNANGGINGHPVQYVVEQEQSSAQQVSALAAKLVDDEKVVAIAGSASLIDCSVNNNFYVDRGYDLIGAGVPNECFTTPNFAPVNQGPYYASLGAAQWLLDQGAKSIVAATTNTPGASQTYAGALELGQQKGVKTVGELESVPIDDANALVLKLASQAGDGGGVLLNFTPPEMLKVLNAVSQQKLVDKVHWACVSCNDASIAHALGADWSQKLGIASEFNLATSTGPDNLLYQQVTSKYAPSVPLGSFGQMGFLSAEFVTKALLSLPAGQPITAQAANTAIKNVKNAPTDILCKPWYFGDLKQHMPNNYVRILTAKNGNFQQLGDCLPLPALPSNALDYVRQQEKVQGLG